MADRVPGYDPLCGERHPDGGEVHGCILQPGHQGVHRCSCWAEWSRDD